MIVTSFSFSFLTIRNRSSVSLLVSGAVGSSRISTFECDMTALTISVSCWYATPRSQT